MKKTWALFFFCFLSLAGVLQAETFELEDGSTVEGILLDEDAGNYYFETPDGLKNLSKKSVVSVDGVRVEKPSEDKAPQASAASESEPEPAKGAKKDAPDTSEVPLPVGGEAPAEGKLRIELYSIAKRGAAGTKQVTVVGYDQDPAHFAEFEPYQKKIVYLEEVPGIDSSDIAYLEEAVNPVGYGVQDLRVQVKDESLEKFREFSKLTEGGAILAGEGVAMMRPRYKRVGVVVGEYLRRISHWDVVYADGKFWLEANNKVPQVVRERLLRDYAKPQ